jgi:hypothetical protein
MLVAIMNWPIRVAFVFCVIPVPRVSYTKQGTCQPLVGGRHRCRGLICNAFLRSMCDPNACLRMSVTVPCRIAPASLRVYARPCWTIRPLLGGAFEPVSPPPSSPQVPKSKRSAKLHDICLTDDDAGAMAHIRLPWDADSGTPTALLVTIVR